MNPFALLFALFLVVPLVEIYFLIKVGGWIGALPTVFLVVFTAVLGVMLLRFQGLMTVQKVRLSMAQGQVPAVPMLEGVLLLVAGALLLTPGFVTDAIGFALLVPPLRQALVRGYLRRAMPFPPGGPPPPGAGEGRSSRGPRVIEGEFKREDD
jgi:UPF0716 protein FxsA